MEELKEYSPEELTIVIRPVTVMDTEHTSLTLRELSVAENVALQKSHGSKTTLEQDIHFFALMCGVPADVIANLKQRDFSRLKNRYWETLGNVEPESAISE